MTTCGFSIAITLFIDEIQSLGTSPKKSSEMLYWWQREIAEGISQQQFMKPAKAQLVVALGNSNTMGITEGQVIVEYYDRSDIDTLLHDYSLQLVLELQGLNRFVVQISNLSRLNEALAELSNDFRVKSTELMVNFGDADLQ